MTAHSTTTHVCVCLDAGGWERVWEHVQTKEKAGSERIAKLVGDVQDLRRQMSQVTQSKDERITAQVGPLAPLLSASASLPSLYLRYVGSQGLTKQRVERRAERRDGAAPARGARPRGRRRVCGCEAQ